MQQESTAKGAAMSTIVLEFNELSPALIDRFIAEGELPNMARMRDGGFSAVTDAEEEAPNLEPWIQWVTVHTGMSFNEHGCFNLNEGAALNAPRIWDLTSAAGQSNWICGSMNGGVQPGFKGHYLPDPWATESPALPAGYFDGFANLVRAYVQEHSARPDVSAGDFARFGAFMVRHGLSAGSVLAALKQLAEERAANVKWRRAMILDRLQWDVFASLWKREKPDFATFFLNSTAHFQHFHWREFEPELFKVRSSDEDQKAFAETVSEGYRNMDRIVGQAMALAGKSHNLVLLTALSQQPMLTHEDDGGRQIFRHRDIGGLLAFAGVEPGWEYAPIMSQQFLLHFASEDAAAAAAAKIEGLRLSDGRQPMWARRTGVTLDAGCMIEQIPAEETQVLSTASNAARGFFELFYPLEALRSGKHHPDGVFWVHGPGIAPQRLTDRVSLRAVAPTLAALAGVEGEFVFAPLVGREKVSLAA